MGSTVTHSSKSATVSTNELSGTVSKSSSGLEIYEQAGDSFLLINATDYLLINAGGDKLYIN